jgi:hypothetical protein
MDLKEVGVTKLLPLIRIGYSARRGARIYDSMGVGNWYFQNAVKRFANKYPDSVPEVEAAAKDFVKWIATSPDEAEVWMVTRSPSNAAKLAISNRCRLSPAAEKILVEKAKDKAGLLEYCTKFGVVLGDLTKIMMKASFDSDARREKEYVRKIQETKRNLQIFLEQMVGTGQMEPNTTVADIISNF